MNARRIASGTLGILTAIWMLFIDEVFVNTPTSCPLGGCAPIPNDWAFDALLVVAILLLISAGTWLAGRWIGLPLSALFSLIAIPLLVIQWNSYGTTDSAVAVLLSAGTIGLDIWALLFRPAISEENHPLNLPVFG